MNVGVVLCNTNSKCQRSHHHDSPAFGVSVSLHGADYRFAGVNPCGLRSSLDQARGGAVCWFIPQREWWGGIARTQCPMKRTFPTRFPVMVEQLVFMYCRCIFFHRQAHLCTVLEGAFTQVLHISNILAYLLYSSISVLGLLHIPLLHYSS